VGSGGEPAQQRRDGDCVHGAGGTVARIEWVDALTLNVDTLSDGGGDGLASDKEPAWSKDGTALAFASTRLRDGSTTGTQHLADERGGEIVGSAASWCRTQP